MIFQNNKDLLSKPGIFFKGGSSGDTYDAAYNARMATIAESQQGMAEDYFNFWKSDYQPMEREQIGANRAMIPYELDFNIRKNMADKSLIPFETEASRKNFALQGAQADAAMELLPLQTDFTLEQIADATTAMRERAPVRSAFFRESVDGVDIESRVNQAAADATQAFMGSTDAMKRNSARMGVNPNSGRFTAMQNKNSIHRAKAIGGAKTNARVNAEQENYDRLQTAMGYGR